MSKCPICNETIQLGDSLCPRCGFKLVGQTEAFSPVAKADQSAVEDFIPVLKVVKGPYNGQEFVMKKGSFTVGRDPSCDLFLNNMTVSRLHATIVIDEKGARVSDEGSLNGTWVDGKVIEESPLNAGSSLQIGTFEMVFMHKRS